MYLNSISKCIFKRFKEFDQEFSTLQDTNKKIQEDTGKIHLDRKESIQNGRNKLKNKWQ